jgi:hypothetical protein
LGFRPLPCCFVPATSLLPAAAFLRRFGWFARFFRRRPTHIARLFTIEDGAARFAYGNAVFDFLRAHWTFRQWPGIVQPRLFQAELP